LELRDDGLLGTSVRFTDATAGDGLGLGELVAVGGGTVLLLFEAVELFALEREGPSRRAACNSLS
jgi:hypothetical protein